MQKNDVVILTAQRYATGGDGVCREGDYTVFVPFLLVGERARVRILKVKDKIAYGRVEELFTPAEERVRPACPVFTKCGGCQLQHLRYSRQLSFKTALVADTLKKIGGIGVRTEPCRESAQQYRYRNKLQLPIGRQNGRNVVGFYAERSHRIVPTSVCPIHPEWADRVISALNEYMAESGADGYDEETGTGILRHILVRRLSGGAIVVLVVTQKKVPALDCLLKKLDGIFPEYSFYLNYNDRNTNVVLGGEFELVKGAGRYSCEEAGIVYEAGPSTFVQVNADVRREIYERAVSLVGAGETVVDCFSGGGLMTAMFAKKCARAYGIEIVPEASACADEVKRKNGLSSKMINICGRVEEELASVLEREKDVTIVLDPPRAGVDRDVLKLIAGSGAKKIIMISCNAATLARDLGILTGTLVENAKGELVKGNGDGAYEIKLVAPYDMFPQTRHIETLTCLERK